jgi:UDP-N-acetylglucosamine--N-acetylmuramyl-(pentapeptide) pyrophosphoryl-undecaprenol N-acetylglucosamine transferase
VLFPVKVVVALIQSALLVWKTKPDVVVGTGGYVCGPVVAAAQVFGRRTLLQEQNSLPGATTRMLASRADEVHIAFPGAEKYLRRRDNIHLTGNPTRDVLGNVSREDGARFFGIDPQRQTLLVFGGSRGAAAINAAIAPHAADLAAGGKQIIWQTGSEEFEALRREPGAGREGVVMMPFIENMEYAYAACDLAVCRSGATSLAELARAGVPSVLVPYPHAAADHQTENARAMVEAGASVLVPDPLAGKLLASAVTELLADGARLRAMAAAARRLGKPDAARELADAVERLARIG